MKVLFDAEEPPKKQVKILWPGTEKQDSAERGEDPPLPRGDSPPEADRGVPVSRGVPADSEVQQIGSSNLITSLWQELKAIKQDRETLSSSIAPAVARLQREGKIVGIKIQDPDAKEQLARLYDQIEALTREGAEVYRRIEACERGGSGGKSAEGGQEGLYHLKQVKRSIQNRRHKLKKKLESGIKPRNPLKLQEWQLQLAALDAEERDINEQLESL